MAKIVLTVDDAALTLLEESFTGHFGYEQSIDGKDNPETIRQFTVRKIIEYTRTVVKEYQVNVAKVKAINDVTTVVEAFNVEITVE